MQISLRQKSSALIKKLEGLCSRHEAQTLHRQVYVTGRVKSMNESVYYSIDTIHGAISADRQISFQYFEWTMARTPRLRRAGQRYHVSPYALVWDNENYCLIAFDATAEAIRHYRVDKMSTIAIEDETRQGQAQFDGVVLGAYTQKTFGMFGGTAEEITLCFDAGLAGPVIDRFGKDVTLVAADEAHFHLRIQAVVSPPFMGWLAGFGTGAKILAPAHVAQAYADFCQKIWEQYQ